MRRAHVNTDTVVRFDPKTEKMQVIQLPSSNVGIRKMATDASGRLWYMGPWRGSSYRDLAGEVVNVP